jgi:hypothetical protein
VTTECRDLSANSNRQKRNSSFPAARCVYEKNRRHNDEINLFADGVFLQNVNPGIEKIARRFVELIARAAQMNIGNVQEFHSSDYTV